MPGHWGKDTGEQGFEPITRPLPYCPGQRELGRGTLHKVRSAALIDLTNVHSVLFIVMNGM